MNIKENNNKNKLLTKLLILSCFFAPFYSLRITKLLGFSDVFFTLSDLLFLFVLYIILINKVTYLKNTSSKKFLLILFLSGYLIILGYLISGIVSDNPSWNTITTILQYAFVYIVFPFIFLHCTKYQLNKMVNAYLFGLIVIIAIGSFTMIFFNSFYLKMASLGYFIGTDRMGSFLGSNGLSKTIAISIPLLYLCLKESQIRIHTLYLYIFLFIVGLVLTSSSGGSISSLLAYILLITLSTIATKKSSFKLLFKQIILSGILVLTIILLIQIDKSNNLGITDKYEDRIVDVILYEDISEVGSFQSKKSLMIQAWTIVTSSPIIGIGANSFRLTNIYKETVHNIYLGLWVEAGIIGVIGILLFLLYSFSISIKGLLNKDEKMVRYSLVCLVCTIILSLNYITDTSASVRSTLLPIFFCITFLLHQNRECKLNIQGIGDK